MCGGGSDAGRTQTHKTIEKGIRKEKRDIEDNVKILLLGSGGSGKSTIAKQMKIIYMNGFGPDELDAFRKILHSNTLSSIKILIKQASDWNIELSKTNKTHLQFITESNAYRDAVTPDLVPHIKALWKDPGIQAVVQREHEFLLPSSCHYCMENIDTIAKPDYVPDVLDILMARQRTTGVSEIMFKVDSLIFTMVDVGGQKNERRKWIHCFENVSAVIFCVGLSDYDLMMVEDSTTNMMHDSLKLFDEISNNRWFVKTDIIIFLNKHDLFKEKATRVNLNVCFEDYEGGLDSENGLAFIRDKYLSLNTKKHIYTHVTVAIDTENVKIVFNIVKKTILAKFVKETGLNL